MSKIILLFCLALFLAACLSAADETDSRFSKNGWTVGFDRANEMLSVTNNILGVILTNLQLHANVDHTDVKLTKWEIKTEANRLHLKTSDPVETDWEFILTENKLDIHSSFHQVRVSAVAPAGKNRFPARIADPSRIQQQEISENNDYTGVAQVEKYFVPYENPQVMYLSLGAIDSPMLYSLFDIDNNTVIRFPADASLKHISGDDRLLNITVPINGSGRLLHLIKNYYTDVLGMPNYIPYDDTYHKTAPTGWNHWLAFFRQVTEKDIVDHADFIAENLKAYGMTHCQLDDGYDHSERRLWNKNWDAAKFPHGPEWLAQYIRGKGLVPGIWTVPYSYSVEDADPDWFLRDDEGKILIDYQGGGELDLTRPEVISEYWIPLWKEFKRQGWAYYKFDMGNTSWMWYHYQHHFSDTSKSSFDVSHETMKIFREIMGPEIWYTNHPDIYGGRMGFIDVAGCGKDPAPGWKAMNNFLEVISNNAYQNHIVWFSDPDCIVLRGKPTRADLAHPAEEDRVRNDEFLTLEEARTCASLLCLSGMQYLSGDDLLNLDHERLDLIKKTIPALPIFPVDLFGRSRYRKHYPEILDLKINGPAGDYDVIAVTNWENKTVSRNININRELVLDTKASFLIFDCWKEKFTGKVKNEFQVRLPAHGTSVFTIRRQEKHPQLLATNRHITAAVSIKENIWNESGLSLSGISETVPGVTYSLFFHVPPGYAIDRINAIAENLRYTLAEERLLTVSFTGQKEPVNWSLKFLQN